MRLTVVALLLLASAACGRSTPDAPAHRADDPASTPAASDPLGDPDDHTPMDPPPSRRAHVSPTPVDAARPPSAAVQAPPDPPNVVLILGCTVRKDQVGAYGGPDGVTPFLDRLAAEGTVFDDTIAAAPWTRAASTALLTGRHAVSLGMVEPGIKRNDRMLPDEVTTLGEHFAARGYLTLGATANPNLNATFGFAQGYDRYQFDLPAGWGAKISGHQLVQRALEVLDAEREAGDDRPVLLRLMLLDAHAPRDAPASAYDPFRTDGEPARMARYRAHLNALDDALATLDAGLAARGLDPSNTLFVVVADHGEGMNYPAHHGFGHGQYFGSSAVHVPWILRGPGVAAGHRVLGPASQVDVLPTLLGLIGRPLSAPLPDGRDWTPQVRGQAAITDRTHAWSDTWFGGSKRAAVFTHTTQCQQDFGSTAKQRKKGKFVPGCFDRHEDPLFTRPVDVPDLMAELTAWREAHAAGISSAGADEAVLDPELVRQLDVLGYVDDDEEDNP